MEYIIREKRVMLTNESQQKIRISAPVGRSDIGQKLMSDAMHSLS